MLARALVVVCLFGIMSYAGAEPAPVYDADTLDSQFQSSLEDTPDFPPPPAPGHEPETVVSQPQTRTAPLSMQERVRRLEQQMKNMQASDASPKIKALQTEVQSLRAQVELQAHTIEQMQTRQKNLSIDMEDRFNKLNTAATKAEDKPVAQEAAPETKPEPIKAPEANIPQPNVAEEQKIYQTAYDFIKAKQYNKAISALQNMIKKYPSGQFAANAHYWLGELYGLSGKNDLALKEFAILIKSYPQSPHAVDAQLKIGLIRASELNWKEAKAIFKKVINQHPGTSSARLATEQLSQIKAAGH